MKDILQEIALNKKREVKALYPTEESVLFLEERAWVGERIPLSMKAAIHSKNMEGKPGLIAEFKRRSPSKGDIAPMADIVPVVSGYEESGVSACSVLTDTRFFGGSPADFAIARQILTKPLLRKDFIVSEIQVTESYLMGADAILLIASLLTSEEIGKFTEAAHRYGMEVLLELHGEDEIEKISLEADMIGVNNRKLASFHTDVNHASSLIGKLPYEVVKVAESGMKTPEEVKRLMEEGYQGFLIGETFMRAEYPAETIKNFLNLR